MKRWQGMTVLALGLALAACGGEPAAVTASPGLKSFGSEPVAAETSWRTRVLAGAADLSSTAPKSESRPQPRAGLRAFGSN